MITPIVNSNMRFVSFKQPVRLDCQTVHETE